MIKNEEVYSEVYELLNIIGKEYIDKIPKKTYSLIENKMMKEYIPKFTDNNVSIENASKEALSIIALFHLNYWCDQKEKEELISIFEENEEINKRKYDISQTFANRRIETLNNMQRKQLIEYKKETFIQKIINKIKFLLVK